MFLKYLLSCRITTVKYGYIFFVVVLQVTTQNLFAQSAKKILEDAAKAYSYGDYFTAARLYEKYLNPENKEKDRTGLPVYNALGKRGTTIKNNDSNIDVVYKLASSYRQSFYFPQAAEQYKKCYETAVDKYPDSYYWYAVCMRSVGNYEEANKSLTKFLSDYSANSSLKSAAEAEKQTLEFIGGQLKRPDTALYVVTKADNIIGLEKGVYAAASAGQSKLVVTSTIKDSTVGKNKNPYRNRLFLANETADHTLDALEAITIEGVDLDANQGTAALHPNGEVLYFTQWSKVKEKSVAGIYYSKKKDGKWTKPEKLSYVNTDGFNSKQPSLTLDGTQLYYSSDLTGGLGGYDLWYSSLDATGMPVSAPVNLGAVINTSGEEQAPYFHPGEKVLIFSTNSRPGMGGYDLFMAKGSGKEWSAPENLGYPVNSTRDDIYYYNSGNDLMKDAYLSSDRGSNCCLETYHVKKLPKKRKLSGLLVSCENSEPLADAEVELNTGSGIKVRTNAEGKFTIDLREGDQPSDLVYSKDSFIAKTSQYKLVQLNENDPLTNVYVNETVCLDKIEVIKPENISPLYFDFDKSKILKPGRLLLDSVAKVLAENPSYKIKVDAHTDSKGSEEYNIKLSKRRADAVVGYLLKKGIDESRISREAFGKAVPFVEDMPNGVYDEEAARLNRRALLHITKP